jgi:hypothetical protein
MDVSERKYRNASQTAGSDRHGPDDLRCGIPLQVAMDTPLNG